MNIDGFYAGKRAFDLILEAIGEEDKTNVKEVQYNGLTIKLDPMSEASVIIGVGEPYAEIAKKMSEHFNKTDKHS